MFIRFFVFFTFFIIGSFSFWTIIDQSHSAPDQALPTPEPHPIPDNRTPASVPFSGVPTPGPFFFRPNFAAATQMFPQGAIITPLCNYINPLLCINQWSQMAIPLSYQQPGALPQYENFLPIFLPDNNAFVADPTGDPDWEMFTLPLISDIDTDYDRTFYRKKSDYDTVRIVQTDRDGNKSVSQGTIGYVNEKDIGSTDGKFVVTKPTKALPATTKEVKPGCFVIDKTEADTEARFNYDCRDCLDQEEDPVLSVLATDPEFVEALDAKHREVARSSARKVAAQTDLDNEDAITKICSPEQSLQTIISNFNNEIYECGITFDSFFKKTYCDSCKKGIPPEIMMAMMSIESGGKCNVEGSIGREGERSIGLFQIESNSHQCGNHAIGSPGNRECLKDPINNLNAAIEILFDHYGKVNPQSLDTSQCPPWNQLNSVQKDSWRRGVSAYNGGPGWVNRATKSGRDERTLTDTSYLTYTHVGNRAAPYRKDTIDWEKLRAYYFVERLSPGNKVGSGRNDKLKQADGSSLDLTVSNIAHTEAVLGRNVTTPTPSMVEIWGQYAAENKPASCP